MMMWPHDAYHLVLDERMRRLRDQAALQHGATRGRDRVHPPRLRWPARLRSHCATGLRRLATRLDGAVTVPHPGSVSYRSKRTGH